MAFTKPSPPPLLLGLAVVLFFLAKPTLAFGAGNIASISRIEGENWRHGDLEDTLLAIAMARVAGGKKFDKLMVSRTYFGNWLRDYSQAVDVGSVKYVSAEAVRLLLCVLGFMTFGFGSAEFEVTADRLGCYRPEDHIDNPKGYAGTEDARNYDRRLRGPIDERVELAVDRNTAMKNYIANERVGIMTSAKHVRNLFSRCIELGRAYGRQRNKNDLYEALRLLGTGLHCLEDFFAHSNYTELALIEIGERDVFPHVGRNTAIEIRTARGESRVYPLVTGTFGSVDLLHSVVGEVSDKVTSNEIQELEGTLQKNQGNDNSVLQDLLDKVPSGLFGGSNKKQQMQDIKTNAATTQMQNTSVSPRQPEEFTRQIQAIFKGIMPAIEFHDEIMKSISEAIDKIPVLPQIMEQLEDQLSVFVFSVIAPLVVPIIKQVSNELRTGSSEVIDSSKNEQFVVFEDDESSDPTHSMLSKDHFSNVLNEIAGKTASKVVAWVVPQIMEAWDNDNVDVNRTLDRIVSGVMHHPAQRQMGDDGASDCRQIMFQSVEQWWRGMNESARDEMRGKLSRRGVKNGENHKEGVHDTGHGCGGSLGMKKQFGGGGGGGVQDQIAGAAAGAIMGGLTSGLSDVLSGGGGRGGGGGQHKSGGIGGFVSGLLGNAIKGEQEQVASYTSTSQSGSYSQTQQYTQTQYSGGGQRTEYERRDEYGSAPQQNISYGYQETSETRPTHGGGYEQRTERRYEDSQGGYRREEETDRWGGGNRNENENEGRHGRHHQQQQRYEEPEQRYGGRDDDNGRRGDNYGRREDEYQSRNDAYERRDERREEGGYGGQQGGYGGQQGGYGGQQGGYGGQQGGYGGQQGDYGGQQSGHHGGHHGGEHHGGRRDDDRREEGGWGEERHGGGGRHGRRDDDEEERREEGGGGGFLGEIARRAGEAFDEQERRGGGGGWGF